MFLLFMTSLLGYKYVALFVPQILAPDSCYINKRLTAPKVIQVANQEEHPLRQNALFAFTNALLDALHS